MRLLFNILFIVVVFISGCSNAEPENFIEVFVEPFREYQTIEGFGASDCWSAQFVGENWPESKKEAIADLLFSKELDRDGNPIGIGLTHWRFNIGGGTAEQGASSEIPNSWRRSECFLNSDGSYDWDKQAGQQWFLRAAQKRGVEKFLAFNNTAPVYFTKNKKGWSPGGTSYNIEHDKMDDYALFLSEVCRHFEEQDLSFDYISPFNESQWDWKLPATQEGSPAHNEDISQLVRLLSPYLEEVSPTTKIVVPEAAQIQFLYEDRGEKFNKRDNQIKELFDPQSNNCVGNLANVKSSAVGHSYYTTNNIDTLIGVRIKLNEFLKKQKMQLSYWQSEYCILEKHKDLGGGGQKRDLGISTALYVARVIHADLAFANASSWSWWTAMSPMDYKDGLIYLDRGDEDLFGKFNNDLLEQDGFYRDSKLLWALGNYSRFIDPGMVRIKTNFKNNLSIKEELNNFMISGYKTYDEQKYVFVAVNYSNNTENISFEKFTNANNMKKENIPTYITSETMNLEKVLAENSKINVPARSVVTIVIKK